jgi:hypothetical protein
MADDTLSYRYRLESGTSHEVCTHMTNVFNKQFRTPWQRSASSKEASTSSPQTSPVGGGRLPGVPYNKDFADAMLLSRYPSSAEFDAVQWKEANVLWDTKVNPALLASLDIDNDGQPDWVVKYAFMTALTTWQGLGQLSGGSDSLAIFKAEDFQPQATLSSKLILNGESEQKAPRHADSDASQGLETYQLRPFIFQGKAYLQAYQAFWPNLELSKQQGRRTALSADKPYPDREYMNILSMQTGSEKSFNYHVPRNMAKLTAVCRVRMIRTK